MAALRVVSWNIRAAIGPGPFPDRWWCRIDADRLHAIGEFLASTQADVVALQEVAVVSREGALVDNPGDLARQLGMEVRYGAVRTFVVTDDADATVGVGAFGNALLSRRPMATTRVVALPTAAMDAFVEPPGADHPAAGITYADAPPTIREPRCLLLADVDGLRVGTTHLSHVGSGERLLQAEACAAAFDPGPAVILGDLNAAIDAPELAPLAGWTDGFGVPAGDDARISTDDGYRIDQVLARDASVQACRVLREAGDLSDHLPVVAEIAWP
ncbi:MAG TPA: endonuclease/exonuclease/phosphatase family protein [Candidatus Limnocylindria bacterium]|nr:endonuclease/exonuclease/phosphatase family protein [Candidatus Limnocylindria bacterium]